MVLEVPIPNPVPRRWWPRWRQAAHAWLACASLALAASCTDTNNNATVDVGLAVMRDAGAPSIDGDVPEVTGEDAPPGPEPGYLWFAAGPIAVFTKSAVAVTSAQGPSFTVVPDIDYPNFHDLVFDRDGNLWAVTQMGTKIVRCQGSDLGSGRPPPIADLEITGPALKGAQSLTFDSNGNLWVMNYGGVGLSTATIIRYDDPGSLRGDVTPDPTLTIAPSAAGQAAFNQGTGIAFDAAGNLWLASVSNVLRIDKPGSATGQMTAAPSAILASPGDAYVSAAFDAGGSLWVTGARSGYFVMRIADPGSLMGNVNPTPAARVRLVSPFSAFAGGMGFDADGALWIAMSDQIIKLENPGALSGNVVATPAVVLSLKSVPDLATKIVFWPTPPGLPLYR